MLEHRLLVVLNQKKAANLEAAEAEAVKAAVTFQRMTKKAWKKRQRQRQLVRLVADVAAFPNSCWQRPSELKSVAASKA